MRTDRHARPAPRRPALTLLGETVAATAAAVWLHGLRDRGWAQLRLDDPLAWATQQPAEAVMAVLRLAALGIAAWFVLSVLAYTAATVLRHDPAAAVFAQTALPGTRRLVDAALATSLVGSLAAGAGPVAAQPLEATPPPLEMATAPATLPPRADSVRPDAAAPPLPGLAPPAPPTPAGDSATTRSTTGPPIPAPIVAPAPTTGPRPASPDSATTDPDRGGGERVGRHRVTAGESLWDIAAAHLTEHRGTADEAAVASYWRRVVAANRPRLRSGNPDLIYPGETILLPELGS